MYPPTHTHPCCAVPCCAAGTTAAPAMVPKSELEMLAEQAAAADVAAQGESGAISGLGGCLGGLVLTVRLVQGWRCLRSRLLPQMWLCRASQVRLVGWLLGACVGGWVVALGQSL